MLEITLPAFSLFAEAVLGRDWCLSEEQHSWSDKQRCGWSLTVALMAAVVFPNNRPHAMRIKGRLAATKAKTKKALRYFCKAIDYAEKHGHGYEHARALIDKSMLDYSEARDDRQRGLDRLESLGCVLPDAEVGYLDIDRKAHHDRAAAVRAEYEKASAEVSA